MLVKAVAADPQPVLGDLAKADQAEDQTGKRGPQQQLPRLVFQILFAALRHLRSVSFPKGAAHMRA